MSLPQGSRDCAKLVQAIENYVRGGGWECTTQHDSDQVQISIHDGESGCLVTVDNSGRCQVDGAGCELTSWMRQYCDGLRSRSEIFNA